MKIIRTALVTIFSIFLLVLPMVSQAELGGNLASINLEQKTFGSTLTSSPQTGYTIYSQNINPGLVIKEYLTNNGNVFAVTWKGPNLPNFQVVLGSYYSNYLTALQNNPRAIFFQDDNIVIESGGVMGGYVGRAYLPKQFPAGMTSANIQ
ncbi:DUF2844 domain-containing protein [Polynucleobacter sp. IMCC 30228]|uniref:DUF2844 domain-containing protein n=1 Tax=Polynucleobacter sp. IMCC 30228 TaxID=2781011 RepID=UPI001F46CF1A|nr:DUF2844 domain-containing protein [Polynucleobacter sp. IMCC 30228]MCE7528026.1 DUF2844 domain-containing protein [Polynucleobacter sp. IMCC 30228]